MLNIPSSYESRGVEPHAAMHRCRRKRIARQQHVRSKTLQIYAGRATRLHTISWIRDIAGVDAGGGRDEGLEKFDEARCASGKLQLNHFRLRPRSVARRRVEALSYLPHDI